LLLAPGARADIVRWDSTNNPQLPAEAHDYVINFVTGKISQGPVPPLTTGSGLGAISVPPPESATCNYRNSGEQGIFTLGPRAADQGVAAVNFGQTIDGTLPYQSLIFSNGDYYAVKFFLSPDATTPNYGWIQGASCDILTTEVQLFAFGYNTVPGQPITAGAAADKSPSLSCAATPTSLWPPSSQPVSVTVSGTITRGTSNIASGNYAVVDEYSQFQPSGSIALSPRGGGYSFQVPLLAARNGDDLDGRTYTIMVVATDAVGNPGSCATVVTVPHDQGN
jgi:hypothetical protein